MIDCINTNRLYSLDDNYLQTEQFQSIAQKPSTNLSKSFTEFSKTQKMRELDLLSGSYTKDITVYEEEMSEFRVSVKAVL